MDDEVNVELVDTTTDMASMFFLGLAVGALMMYVLMMVVIALVMR